MRSFLNTFVFCGLIALALGAVPEQDLFPFGLDNGDKLAPSEDDGVTKAIKLHGTVTVYDDTYTWLYLTTDGVITPYNYFDAFTPKCPRPNHETGEFNIIKPYWADVDISQDLGGAVYYRVSDDSSLKDKAVKEIQAAYPKVKNIQITTLLIATWQGVPFFGAKACGLTNETVPRNTFQAIVAGTNSDSYAIYYYTDIQWTTGIKSGGDCQGLGGSPASAGWVADNTYGIYGSASGSCQDQILNVTETSNYNSPGKYVFRLTNY
jgi:hypothetical protein